MFDSEFTACWADVSEMVPLPQTGLPHWAVFEPVFALKCSEKEHP